VYHGVEQLPHAVEWTGHGMPDTLKRFLEAHRRPPAEKGVNTMTLVIELPPELAQRLEEEAARRGQAPVEFVRAAVEEKLGLSPAVGAKEAQQERNREALALLRQWRKEDAENPDTDPVPVIAALSLREVELD
jgi:predicted transcriptional regulator